MPQKLPLVRMLPSPIGICLPNSVKIALFGVFGEANSLGNSMRALEVYSGSSHRISDVEVQNEH